MFMCTQIDDLKNIFKIINTLDAEASLTFSEKGLAFHFITRDATTFVDLVYFKSNFNKYEFTKAIPFKFKTQYLHEIMKQASKDDTVYFSFDEGVTKLKVTVTKKERKKAYELTLMELEARDTEKNPSLEFTIKTTANNKELMDLLDSMIFITIDKHSSDSITVEASQDGVVIKEEGSKMGKSTFTLKDFTKEGIKDKIVCKFGGSLFKKIVHFSTLFSEKSIYEMRKDYPIKITTITPQLELVCVLAPRVDQE